MDDTTRGIAAGFRLETLSRNLFYLALALLPLFFVPLSGYPLLLGKVTAVGVLFGLSAVLFLAAEIQRGVVHLPRALYLGACTFLPAVYVVSAFFSQNPLLSWFGQGVETDTVFFVLFCYLVVLLTPLLIRNKERLRILLWVFFGSASLAALYQAGVLVLALSPLDLVAPTHNLIGKWNDLGAYSALSLIASIATLQFVRLRGVQRNILVFLATISFFVVFLVNLDALWVVLFLASVLVFVLGCFPAKRGGARRMPLIAVFLGVICGLSFFYADPLSRSVAHVFGVSEIEARPSLMSTLAVGQATYEERSLSPFLGSGPNTFGERWRMHKPAEVNTTAFWNIDFATGFGTIPTAFVSTGAFGGAAWLLVFLGLLFMTLRLFFRLREGDDDLLALGLAVSFAALAAFSISFVYPLNQTILLLAFILSGGALAASRAYGGAHDFRFSLAEGPGKRAAAGTIVGVGALLSLGGMFFLLQQAASEGVYLAAIRAGERGNLERAGFLSNTSLSIKRSDKNLRLAAEVGLLRLQQIATGPQTESARAEFEAVLRPALEYALEGVRYDPRNYLNWLALGRMYEFLSLVGVQGSYENAKASYAEAMVHNPTNPGLHLNSARLEASRGNYSAARESLAEALTQKVNFTEAILFTVQMEYARGNIAGATVAAKAAVAASPQNPARHFELGLLQYMQGDFAGAVESLKGAINILPRYANAMYFLGLSYERVGMRTEARALFEELLKNNPTNAEVQRIVENIRLGRSALEGIDTALQAPLERNVAPIAE